MNDFLTTYLEFVALGSSHVGLLLLGICYIIAITFLVKRIIAYIAPKTPTSQDVTKCPYCAK